MNIQYHLSLLKVQQYFITEITSGKWLEMYKCHCLMGCLKIFFSMPSGREICSGRKLSQNRWHSAHCLACKGNKIVWILHSNYIVHEPCKMLFYLGDILSLSLNRTWGTTTVLNVRWEASLKEQKSLSSSLWATRWCTGKSTAPKTPNQRRTSQTCTSFTHRKKQLMTF